MKPYLFIIPGLGLLSSCGFFKADIYKPDSVSVGKAVTSFRAPEAQRQPLRSMTVADMIARFETVKNASLEPQQQYLVARRLAQLRLLHTDQQMMDGAEVVDYDVPIAALHELQGLQGALESKTDLQTQSEITYQLAKLQELKGAPDHVLASLIQLIDLGGDDPATWEARFRRAEIYFSRGNYPAAESDYATVSRRPGQYQLHARYMLTWVRFKRGDLDGALDIAGDALAQLAALAKVDNRYQELKRDLLRVLVIALDYSDGPVALAKLMANRDKPSWQTDIYRALGDWYLGKSRFNDSAATWSTFVAENPGHRDAPRIALQVIDTQREAGFVNVIPGLELDFIEAYGKQSEFYRLHGDAVFEGYQSNLKPMLEAHILRLHAAAQQSQKYLDYLSAAVAYQSWLVNFAGDADTQEKRFLLAEAFQDGGARDNALAEYERVIIENETTDFAREAAYALVLGSATAPIEAQVDANLRFVRLFNDDSRAAMSQLKAANLLFQEHDFERAKSLAAVAATMVNRSEDLETAKRIQGHSAFELGDFAVAAKMYRALQQTRSTPEIQARLLAAVFKQGAQAEAAGDLTSAISFYRELTVIDSNAELTLNAEYDIAALYERMGDTAAAIDQLISYREKYQKYPREINVRLIELYETSGQLESAAKELLAENVLFSKADVGPTSSKSENHSLNNSSNISSNNSSKETGARRYRAAELYLQASNLPLAIEHFRFYAHTYPEPAALQLEAMHQMAVLYQQTQEPSKRRFWLRKIRDRVVSLDHATERARYLGAASSLVLAEDQFEAFKAIPLTQPLQRSLKKKQQALQASLKAFDDVASFSVLEFVTRANLATANLYQVLAEDLLASERPRGLNALEQDQYQLLLEEQAYPFEEQAIESHQENLSLGWKTGWDDAVNQSLLSLQLLSPGRFARQEREVAFVDTAE